MHAYPFQAYLYQLSAVFVAKGMVPPCTASDGLMALLTAELRRQRFGRYVTFEMMTSSFKVRLVSTFLFFNKRTQESHGPKGFLRFWSLGELFTEGLKFNLPLIPINAWEDGGLWGWMDLWSKDMASISKFCQVAGWPQGKLWRATSSHAWPGLFALLGSAHFASCCTWTQGRQLFFSTKFDGQIGASSWQLDDGWYNTFTHITYNHGATALPRVRGLAVGPCSFPQSRCWWHVLSRCLWADSIAPCSTGQTTDSPGGMADDGRMADVHVFARIFFMLAVRVGGIPFGLVWHDVSWRRMSLR